MIADKTKLIARLVQWNLDLTKGQGTGEICSLYREAGTKVGPDQLGSLI